MVSMTKSFENKTVLVTGAGGGIGLAIVEKFLSQGANLIVSDYNEQSLRSAVSMIKNNPTCFDTIPGDLADSQFCDRLPIQANECAQRWNGKLDIVVNNAGIMRRGNILNTTDQDWSMLFKINVESLFRICRTTIALMKSQGGGTIVNTASCWGKYPGPDHLAYCTSKAAVAAMTQCLGRDHAQDNIRVNAVCPNEVNTPMLKTGFEMRGYDPDSAIEELNQTVPLGRIAEPEDIADVIAFLASDDARYVCGSLIEVNGAKPVY